MERIGSVAVDPELRAKLDRFKAFAEEAASQPLGPPLNPPDGKDDCEKCHGAGWYQVNDGERYTRCRCAFYFGTAEGCPYEFREIDLEAYGERDGQKTAAARARDFLATTSGRDLYLHGGVGAGKTRLAAALANTAYRKGRTVHFARVPLLLHQLQPGRDNRELEDRLMSVSVLVLDDIGAERDQATDYTRRTLLMLYEARHDEHKRTVFTSNKSLQELADMQDDDRLTSRIAGRSDVVRLTTPDQRLRTGKRGND